MDTLASRRRKSSSVPPGGRGGGALAAATPIPPDSGDELEPSYEESGTVGTADFQTGNQGEDPSSSRPLPNPFWSEKATMEFQLSQSRPHNLPRSTGRDEDVELHPPYRFPEPAQEVSGRDAGGSEEKDEPKVMHLGRGASSPGSSGKASILERGETAPRVEVRSYALQVTESPVGPSHKDQPGTCYFQIGSDSGDTPFREQVSAKGRSLEGEDVSQKASTAGRSSDVRDVDPSTVAALMQRVKDLEAALVAERSSGNSSSMKSATGSSSRTVGADRKEKDGKPSDVQSSFCDPPGLTGIDGLRSSGKWVYVDGGYRQLALNAQGMWTLLPGVLAQPPPPPVQPQAIPSPLQPLGPSWTWGPVPLTEGPAWTCPAPQLPPVPPSLPDNMPVGSGFFTPPQIPDDFSGFPQGLVEFVGIGAPGYASSSGFPLTYQPTPMPSPVEPPAPEVSTAPVQLSIPMRPVELSVPGAATAYQHYEPLPADQSLSPVPPPPPIGLGPAPEVHRSVGFRVDRTPGGTPVPPMPPPLSPPAAGPRREELRYSPQWQRWHDLPHLSELKTDEAPILVGDWVTLIGPIIGDISTGAGLWWSKVKVRAEALYAQWLNATPLQRAQIEVKLGAELSQPQYTRLEQRVTSMLLASLPDNLKQDILASRVLNSVNVLFRVMVAGQPGGTAERATLLNFLTQPGTAQGPTEALEKLRKYSRWRSRAEQLKVSLPDPSLLLRAVESIVAGIVSSNTYRELAFRLSVLKLELSLDHVPTHEKVEKFRKQVHAEMELLAVSAQAAAHEEKEKRQRVRRVKTAEQEGKDDKPEPRKGKGGDKPGGKDSGKGSKGKPSDAPYENNRRACQFWGSAKGCNAGRSCQYHHDLSVVEDGSGRCFECSSTEHWRNACPVLGRGPSTAAGSTDQKPGAEATAKADPKRAPRRRVRKIGIDAQGDEPAEAKSTGQGESNTQTNEMLSEAIAAIKSLRVSKLHYVAMLSNPEDAHGGLLDGGATTSLRQAIDLSEWQAASQVTVHLASGETDSLRIAPSGILLAEPSELSKVHVAPIVALHQLIGLGFQVKWTKRGFTLRDPEGSPVRVTLVGGCPEVSKDLALSMIAKIEGAASVSKPNVNRLSGPLEVPVTALATALLAGDAPHPMRWTWLCELLGPQDGRILVKVLDETRVEAVGSKPRFNRRCRRTLSRSEGIVVVVGDPKAYVGTIPSGWQAIRLSHHEVRDAGIPAFLFELAQLGLIRQVVCTDLPSLFPAMCGGSQVPEAQPSSDALVLLRLLHLCGEADRGRKRAGFKVPPLFLCESDNDPQVQALLQASPFQNVRHGVVKSLMYHQHQCREYDGVGRAVCLKVAKLAHGLEKSSAPKGKGDASFTRHIANGHLPFRRDCATCLRGRLMSRPHRRIKVPDSFVLGCDLSGPYANGNHEKLKKVRYCLHAVLTVPVLVSDILKQDYDYEPSDPGEGEQQDASNVQVEPFGNDGAELSVSAMKSSPPDVHDVPGVWEFPEEGFVEEELPKRVGDGDAISEDGGDDDDDGAATGEVPLKEVRMLEVPYMITLPDKKAKTVTNALKEVLADLAYWGLPVRRVHTDKGAEFTNALWRQLLADHRIRRTTTVGSDFKANGRTEAHIGRVKGLTRALLAAASANDADWAFAMRHAVFSMRSQVFTILGFPQREPIPFYTKVWVRKKEWTLHLWAPRCLEARVMAPSESAPGGYVVHLQPSHASDVWDGLQGYFETTALIQGVKATEPVFEASGEVSVVPPDDVKKGMPVTEESSKAPAHSMPSGPSSRLRRKTPDPLYLDPPHAVRALVDSLEAISKDLLHRAWTQVLRLLPHKPIRRGSVSALGSGAQYRSFGMFTHGGVLGVTTASRQFPHTQRYLLAVLRHHHPQATFTSFVVSVNCSSPLHRDYFNDPDSLNYVVGGAEHSGGGLWIEVGSEVAHAAAPGALHFREVAPRRWLPGMMWDTVGASFSFSPHRFHAGDSWSGHKYLLVAFTLKRCARASLPIVTELASADFPLPSCCPASDAGGGAHSKFSLSTLIGPPTSAQEPSSGAGLSTDEIDAESDFSEEASCLDSVGKVESELWFEAAEKVSFLRVEARSLSFCHDQETHLDEPHGSLVLVDGPVETCVEQGLEELNKARVNLRSMQAVSSSCSPVSEIFDARSEGIENLLAYYQVLSGPGESKNPSVARQVYLRGLGESSSAPDALVPDHEPPPLQTKTVSLDQVRRELVLWKPAISAEYDSLRVKGVLEPISEQQIAEWITQGRVVLRLPSKGVFTRKAVTGLRKARCVACGNHGPSAGDSAYEHRLLTYAGGIDASALRLSLAFISQHPDWEVWVTDVKTAFLNAKSSDGVESNLVEAKAEELIVLDPPRIFQLAGVVSKWERWLVKGALYGLDRSPRCWASLRDRTLKTVKVKIGDTVICLKQLVSEPNAWLLTASSGGIVGLLVVYVDDLMIGGVAKYASAILAEIRSIWQCSEPDQLSPKSPVRFCGVEIERQGRALLIHQASYIEDVVKRYEESLGAPLVETSCPFPKVQDPEEPESSSPVALRKAQALAGELLWVSGKTRVDIVYGVARVTSLVSRCPELAFKLGMHILCYLKGTKRIALKYQCTDDQPPHGVHNERRVTALPYLLESFTDASFAPAGDKSFEAGLVQVGRNLVFWSAGKQPFTALSTAEAELLGVLEGVALTESLEGLVRELYPGVPRFPACQAFCDNLASILIASFESGNWRTRHLRVRSQAFRERLQSGKWHLSHLKGEHMLADIATKVLPWVRVKDLLFLCGYEVPSVKASAARLNLLKQALAWIVVASLPVQAQGKGGVEGSKQDDWSGRWVLIVLVLVVVLGSFLVGAIGRFLSIRRVGPVTA